MVKCIFIFFLIILSIGNLNAQNRTNIWMLGYNYGITYPDLGFDFSDDTLSVFNLQRPMGFFFTDASICDTAGNLLFYTNGITIENSMHDTLDNSLNFNPGWITDYYDNGILGLGVCGGAIIIPRPEYSDEYYLFSESAEYISTPFGSDLQPLELRYSLIDMKLDGGLGGIVPGKKTISVINNTLSLGRIAACKHGNGRDWWILVHQYYSSKYFKLLVTPDSIYGPFEQEIGFKTSYYDPTGAAFFSPDGTKYFMMDIRDSIDIFDFDRCTGELSNEVMVIVPDTFNGTLTGSALSPNGRFLYVTNLVTIFQYDLWASDVASSFIEVAQFQDTVSGLQRWFAPMQLASDGKIYISTWSGGQWMHKIEYPDSLGLDCKVIQNVLLPGYNSTSVPNFPNYDLGPLNASACDSLTNIDQEVAINSSFKINPNPITDWLNITYHCTQDAIFELFDINGRRVANIILYRYFKNRLINMNDLPSGVYLAAVTCNGERCLSDKVIVQH